MPDLSHSMDDAPDANMERQVFVMASESSMPSTHRSPRRPKIGRELVDKFGNGKWHDFNEMVVVLNVDADHLDETLKGIRKNKTYQADAEERRGKTIQWRIIKIERSIPVSELLSEIRPLVQALRIEGRKNMATMSPATVAVLAGRLEKLLWKWSDRPQSSESRQRSRPKGSNKDSSHDTGRFTKDDRPSAQLYAGQVDHRADDAGTGRAVRNDDPVADGTSAGREESQISSRKD